MKGKALKEWKVTLHTTIWAKSQKAATRKVYAALRFVESLNRGTEVADGIKVETRSANDPDYRPVVWQGRCSCPLCNKVIELRRGETLQEKGWVINQTGRPFCPDHKGEALE